MKERELLAQRAGLLESAKSVSGKAEAENRDLSTDEQTAFDKAMADVGVLDKRIERSRVIDSFEFEEPEASPIKPTKAPAHLRGKLGDTFEHAFGAYIRDGDTGGVRSLFTAKDGVEIRASNNTDMNITTAADGGYVDPTQMYNQVIAKRTEMSLPEKLGCRKIPGKGTTVNVPYDNETDGEFVSTAEGVAYDQDAPALGQASLTLVKYTKYITLSHELLEDEDANLMTFLADWIARGQAKTYNSLMLTEAAASGTAFKTTAGATAIAAGEIEPVVFNDYIGDFLDDSNSVGWVMKPSTYGYVSALTGNPHLYVGIPGAMVQAKELMGYPVHFSTKAGAITSAQKSAYFANWNFMGWREAPGFTMLRDPYSAASTGQVKLWMHFRTVFKVLQPYAVGYLLQAT